MQDGVNTALQQYKRGRNGTHRKGSVKARAGGGVQSLCMPNSRRYEIIDRVFPGGRHGAFFVPTEATTNGHSLRSCQPKISSQKKRHCYYYRRCFPCRIDRTPLACTTPFLCLLSIFSIVFRTLRTASFRPALVVPKKAGKHYIICIYSCTGWYQPGSFFVSRPWRFCCFSWLGENDDTVVSGSAYDGLTVTW